MLAPRKKLWSAPKEVVRSAIKLLELDDNDILLDIGCGDGRVMIEAAQANKSIKCVGIEIDEKRAEEARANIAAAGASSAERCTVICGNALEQDLVAISPTKVFLYLIPRGLRIILPVLQAIIASRGHDTSASLPVVTYMSPFPNPQEPVDSVSVSTANHNGAKWPLWKYHIQAVAAAATTAAPPSAPESNEKEKEDTDCTVCAIPCVVS